MDDVLQNQAFQSILQLSVGTNITFAVIFSLFDNTIEREKKIAQSLVAGATRLSEQANLPESERQTILADAESIYREIARLSEHLERLIQDYVRPVCLLSALAALYFLISSSYNYNEKMDTIGEYGALATLAPFLIFSGYVIIRTSLASRRLRSMRLALDDQGLASIPTNSPDA